MCCVSPIFVDNIEQNMTKSKSKSKKSEKGKESNNTTNASDNRVSNYSHFNEKDSEIVFLKAAILEVISHSK